MIIFKPDNILYFIKKLSKESITVEYQDIDSNGNFLKPKISIDQMVIKNFENEKILSFDNIEVGIKLFELLINQNFHLDPVFIKDVNYYQNSFKESPNINFKLRISNFLLESEDLNFLSKDSYIISSDKSISIINYDGKINNVPYNKIDIFKSNFLDKYLYNAEINLNEKIIESEKLFDLSGFNETKVNLYLESKGYFNSLTQELNSINKIIIEDSRLVSKSDYAVESMQAVIFSNLNKKYVGSFSSRIPDQNISGFLLIENDNINLNSVITLDLRNIFDFGEYLSIDGVEKFNAKMILNKQNISLELNSNLNRTTINSSLEELRKEANTNLITNILISDLSKPTYFIQNKKFKSLIDENNNGYFYLGTGFDKEINKIQMNDGFYLFLDINKLKINNINTSNTFDYENNLRLIKLRINQLELLNNTFKNQEFEINLLPNEINTSFKGDNLNGTARVDQSGFTKINIFDSELDLEKLFFKKNTYSFDESVVKLRLTGKNIKILNDVINNVDFYILKNANNITFDNIFFTSKNINIGPYQEKDKAYISFNNKDDLYKIRGSFEIDSAGDVLNSLVDFNFEYVYADLNIQWEGYKDLKNLEGNFKFKIKELESSTPLPDSVFLRTLKIFNLNALLDNIDNDTSLVSNNLLVNRAEGDFYVGKNRALITKTIKLETSEAKMEWTGDIQKNESGYLDILDLDLKMRLKVSENIPWYAVIFGGIPALAGGLVFENIIDETLDDVSTFEFNIAGSINEPKITRLD
ncbi:MAG: AsmA-like C-terminal region-containing protein [Gammaproteobacteria bacterium]